MVGRPFQKGQSGNPGGKPKELAEVIQLARKKAPAAIERLGEWMTSDNPAASVAACTALLDRGYGKPTVTIAGDPDAPLVAEIRMVPVGTGK